MTMHKLKLTLLSLLIFSTTLLANNDRALYLKKYANEQKTAINKLIQDNLYKSDFYVLLEKIESIKWLKI